MRVKYGVYAIDYDSLGFKLCWYIYFEFLPFLVVNCDNVTIQLWFDSEFIVEIVFDQVFVILVESFCCAASTRYDIM